jgi:tetratricopeptide (TPR) repeat protein
MTRRTLWLALALGASVAAAAPRVAMALGDTTGAPCGVTAGGGTASNNTITCNFGLTPEQLREVTKAAVEGATEPLISKIGEISKRLGITEEAAKTLLRIVGEQSEVPDERLAEALTKVANDYKRLQTQVKALNPDNPVARDLVEGAKSEIAAGHFAAAHQLLMQARQAQIAAAQEANKLAEQAQAARDAQLLGAAASAAAEGDLAMTELHYAQAADLFKQAAELVPAGHPDETTGYLQRQADALYRQGDERGDYAALKQSIDTGRLVLQQRPRARVPLDWAVTQNNLGIALQTLGERESGTARLQEAVAAYRAALEEWTRDRVPLQWAMTQMNLGNALERLGERESGTARLEEAVAAYRAALEERTRDRVPLDWAATQNNLGIALATRGERESGTARLEEAVAAYRAALEQTIRQL